MSSASTDAGTGHEATSRIEWLELFFDLVVVAAVAVLSEGLRHDGGLAGVGIFLVLYAALWMAWTSVVMYADVAGELTGVRTVVVSMFLVAIMAATAPSHFEGRANAFAIAFVLVRVFAARSSLRTGRLMSAWPLLQLGGFTVPWIASLWVDVPWKYWVWAAALVLDLALVLLRDAPSLLRDWERRTARRSERREARRGDRPGRHRDHDHSPRVMPELHEVGVNSAHLDERLGLFVIIVLGESVAALVIAASGQVWNAHFIATAVAAFLLLVGLWLLTFSYGFAAAPDVPLGSLPPRFGLPLHLLSTLGILLLGVALGEAAATDGPLTTLFRWLACAGLSLHFASSVTSGWLGGAPRRWLLGWGLPAVVWPMAVGAGVQVIDARAPSAVVIALLSVPVLWQYAYAQRHHDLVGLLAARDRAAGDPPPQAA